MLISQERLSTSPRGWRPMAVVAVGPETGGRGLAAPPPVDPTEAIDVRG